MNAERFTKITSQFSKLRIAVVGDFCLDRYLEIDPAKKETSIETGLPVHNVTNVRSQPGGAGTILNNLVALGIGEIHPVGFAGDDGEGFELRRHLQQRGVKMDSFIFTNARRTFTYTKPLILQCGKPPRELNRLDIKNWTRTPAALPSQLIKNVKAVFAGVDAVILLDQVDKPETGVITKGVLKIVRTLLRKHPDVLVLADSRRSLRHFPSVIYKMNAQELGRFARTPLTARSSNRIQKIKSLAIQLAAKNHQPVFVTLAEDGIIGALPTGEVEHVPALPVRGAIDVVGAGDAVTANLTAALAAKANLREALEIANAAASIVVHQLGTTGTASVKEIWKLVRM